MGVPVKMKLTVDRGTRVLMCGGWSVLGAALIHVLWGGYFCVTFITLWAVVTSVYLAITTIKVRVDGKTVLITGCDSGFGHALALHLDAMGFRVMAGCLRAEGGEGGDRLRSRGSSRLHVIQLDLTRQDQITRAVQQVKDIIGPEGSLWGLVNNAAIHTYGAVEWVSMDTFKKNCDVNLFGTLAVTKAFLPLIRKARGRVVSVSSLRGRQASPLGSPYEISKFALEALNDCLRMEMKAFGVDVCLIEPGNYCAGTSILTESLVKRCAEDMWAEMDEEVKAAYTKDYYDEITRGNMAGTRSGNPDVQEVIDALTEALTQVYPHSRYRPMNAKLHFILFCATHFPEWLTDFVVDQLIVKSYW